jgi:hypothetical protein
MAVDSDKPLSIALEEIAAEKIVAVEPSGDEILDPLSFIDMGNEDPVATLSLITGDGDASDVGTEDAEPA